MLRDDARITRNTPLLCVQLVDMSKHSVEVNNLNRIDIR